MECDKHLPPKSPGLNSTLRNNDGMRFGATGKRSTARKYQALGVASGTRALLEEEGFPFPVGSGSRTFLTNRDAALLRTQPSMVASMDSRILTSSELPQKTNSSLSERTPYSAKR